MDSAEVIRDSWIWGSSAEHEGRFWILSRDTGLGRGVKVILGIAQPFGTRTQLDLLQGDFFSNTKTRHSYFISESLPENNSELLSSLAFFDLFPLESFHPVLFKFSSLQSRTHLRISACRRGGGGSFILSLESLSPVNEIAMDKEQRKRKRPEEESTRGASSSSSISPEATGLRSGQYDVFLNFRGSDTRKTFTDHLYRNLVKAGTVPFCVFRDENNIPIGEEFGSEILDAIVRSKISIPVISENYASSKWCLHELVHIMECKKSMQHIVLPIFYKVAPSDVRHLKGNFGNAFHLRRERYYEKDIQEWQQWQQALNEVSYLHGWESDKFEDGHDYDKGEVAQFAMYMWEDCGFYPNQGIEELKLRCLIKIGDDGEFMVHDQLRDLGRSIFCQGQPPEKCSGPWDDNYEGVPRVVTYPERRPCFHDFLGAASSGDSKFSEVRWVEWINPGNDESLSTINLHLPKLSVLDFVGEESQRIGKDGYH